MSDPRHQAEEIAPRISDGTVTLRAHEPADAAAITQQCNDPVSVEWTTAPRGYTEAMALEWIGVLGEAWRNPSGDRAWAVECEIDGERRFVGTVELRHMTDTSAELAYGLHPAARGRGVLDKALRLLLDHAFTVGAWGAPLTVVHWKAIVGNWASRRAAWRLGFTFQGTMPGLVAQYRGDELVPVDGWYATLERDDPREPDSPWNVPVSLRGNGIHLRPFRGDEGAQLEPFEDPAHWFPTRTTLTPDTFSAWLLRQQRLMAEGEATIWCVADATDDRMLGSIFLFAKDNPTADDAGEVGYRLLPSARGRGVAKEALRLVVAHAFMPADAGGLGLRRLVAETAADNEASNAVLRSAGFVTWGREHAVDPLPDSLGGGYGDGLHWELFRA